MKLLNTSSNGRIERWGNLVIQTFFRAGSKNWGVQVFDYSEYERANYDRSYSSMSEFCKVGFTSEELAYQAGLEYCEE